jgi:AraC-like DNA-binding protein
MRTYAPSSSELLHGQAATPIVFVRTILLGYRKYGADPANALREAQISDRALEDPASRITAAQLEKISGQAMQELDDEALGWFSRRLPWGSYGMLCRASLTSPTLEVALKRWCRHHRLLTDDLVLELTQDRTTATVTVVERRDFGAMREFCLVTILRYLLGYACWLVDSRIPLRVARFPFAAPPHADAYTYMFRSPIEFGAASAAVSFDARYLGFAVCRDETALRAMLQRALPLTVLQYRRDRLLVENVRQLLRRAPEAALTAEHVAGRLHLSVRTLHRQLKEEGASLQDLKDEARREHAVGLLQTTTRPIKQIAAAVGFASEKSFARAFKHWTGQSPLEFRDRSRRTVQ